MKKKLLYRPIDEFQDYFARVKKRRWTFQLHKTTYSRSVETDDMVIMFTGDGSRDKRVLQLISKVRSDAEGYLDRVDMENLKNIKYFDVIETPTTGMVSKVDINSAYWKTALQKGVITQGTDDFLKDIYDKDEHKIMKQARLKALGSLATTKTSEIYHHGKLVPDITLCTARHTKAVYKDICASVDRVMCECASEVENCFYYYWDCMFVDSNFEKKAVEFFKSKDYEVKVGHCTMRYEMVAGNYYLMAKEVDSNEEKQYMVRAEDRFILEQHFVKQGKRLPSII